MLFGLILFGLINFVQALTKQYWWRWLEEIGYYLTCQAIFAWLPLRMWFKFLVQSFSSLVSGSALIHGSPLVCFPSVQFVDQTTPVWFRFGLILIWTTSIWFDFYFNDLTTCLYSFCLILLFFIIFHFAQYLFHLKICRCRSPFSTIQHQHFQHPASIGVKQHFSITNSAVWYQY